MRHLALEGLERRELLAINLTTNSWTPVGPAPINGGAFVQPTTPGNNPVSGRITAIAASSSDPNTIYIGGADGGVWKTTDGGTTWTPLTDNQRSLAIGSLAIAPSNPSIIYAGTGESNNSGDSQYGRGILKSTDAGATWTLLGNFQFDRRAISKIIVDPTNPNVVYASVTAFAVNGLPGNTGVWKSSDGGTTWSNTTASISTSFSYNDMVMDPTNSQILYVGASNPFGLDANSGVYKTTNGGGSWALVGPTLPSGISLGRIALAISKSNPQQLVAAIVDPSLFSAKLYKTLDGGANWTALTAPNFTGFQGWYDLVVGIDPSNANIIYASGAAGSNSVIESQNGGTSWTDISVGQSGSGPHVDHHALVFDASGRLLDGDDGGIFRLDNNTPGSIAWSDLNGNLQISQFYSVSLHPTDPNIAFGGTQDNGVVKFSGNLGWTESDGGDGGVTVIDPFNPNTIYHAFPQASSFFFFVRSDDGGQTWLPKISGINSNDPMNFIQPFVADPSNPGRLLFGTNRVYETTNHGDVWTPISAPNQNGWTSNAPIDAIAISKSSPNTIYATAGGDIFVTTNDGGSWKQVDIPAVNDHFAALIVDPNSSLTAYAVHDRFGGQELFRTTDGGNTWRDISGNLPAIPADSIALDTRPNSRAIYLGTDSGVFVSTNGGGSWTPFRTGMPNTQVLSLALNPSLNILAAGTHGRGMFETLIADIIQVSLTPPQATEGSPLSNAPVATFTDAAASDPVGNYLATIDWGDGTPTTTGVVQANSNGSFSVLGSHTYAEEGTFNMTVSVTDSDGASNKATGSVTVADAPLNATASGAVINTQEGGSIGSTKLASFVDTNPNAPPSDFSATINWGDGQVSIGTIVANTNGGYDVFGSHTFVEGGQQLPIKVTISDVGGAQATVTDTAIVTDFPLTAQGTTISNLVEGSTASNIVATFTDADPDNPSPSEYTVTIDWGDGTTTGGSVVNDPVSGFDVIGAHAYDEGSFSIKVTIVDGGGSTATATSSATVTDAPITVQGIAGGITAIEGIAFNGVIGSITDTNPSGSASDFTITIDWGDGSSSPGTAVAQGNGLFQITGTHVFNEVKSYNISISVADEGGKTGSATTTASVGDAPLAALGTALSITEGSPFTGVVATFADLDPLSVASDFTATIDWGDHTTSVGTIQADPKGGFDVIGTHNTFEEGAPLLTIVINDKGGASTSAVTTASVIDAPLSGTALAVSGTEATALVNVPVATLNDGNPSAPVTDFTATINWGDQTALTTGKVVAIGPGKFQILGSHTYALPGGYTITTTVADKGGSTTQILSTAAVAVLVVPVTGSLAPTSDSGVSHTDGVTDIAQPIFTGLAKPNTTVTLFGIRSGTNAVIVLGSGKTDSLGNWAIQSATRLADGSYFVLGADTDSKGNMTGPNMLLPASGKGLLVIDTVGPKILGSMLNPRTGQVTVIFSDDRSGMSQPALLNKLNYALATNTLPPRPIGLTNLSAMPAGPNTTIVVGTFNGGVPLGVGSFVLTITAQGVTDAAGNALVETHFVNFPQLGNSLPGNYIAEFDTNGVTTVGALQYVPLSAQTAAEAYTQFLLNRLKIRLTR